MRRSLAGTPGPRPGGVRSTLAAAACTGVAVVLGLAASHAAAAVPMRVEAMVSCAALGTGAVAAAVLAVGCALLAAAAVGRAFGRSLDVLEAAAARLTPVVLRRVLAVTITTGLGLGSASVAVAAEPDLGWTATGTTSALPWRPVAPVTSGTGSSADLAPAGAPASSADATVPDADATVSDADAPKVTTGAPEAVDAGDVTVEVQVQVQVQVDGVAVVTVVPGDTLWGLAADHLPPDSGDAAVAAAWPRWYEANRDVIGADPDLIRPGQVLVVPTSEEPR